MPLNVTPVGIAIGSNHFFDATDIVSQAIKKISNQTEESLRFLFETELKTATLPQIEVLGQADLLLQNIQLVYENARNQKIENAGQVKTDLTEIDALIYDHMNGIDESNIRTTLERVQTIISSLSKHKNMPIIAAFSPSFVTPFYHEGNIDIRCFGRVPPEATLRVNNKTVSKEIGNDYFSVPFFDLFPDLQNASRSTLQKATYSLEVPYQSGYFHGSKTVKVYQGIITLLPDSPGKIETKGVRVEEEVEKKLIVTPTRKQTSRPYQFDRTVKNQPYHLDAEPGWEIEKDSATFHPDEVKGRPHHRVKWSRLSESATRVTYIVTTHRYRPHDHCDKILFRISAIQQRTVHKEKNTTEELQLKWSLGSKLTVDANYSIVWHSFDGTKQSIKPDFYSRFLGLREKEGRLWLIVNEKEDLSLFQFHRLTVPLDPKL
ncbi:MAG: hypothetical protein KBA81_03235 [Rhabdochlamydiaceae bacterium]|nr:hypothetical protein [Rhabdochlamydiaceae bacterium]